MKSSRGREIPRRDRRLKRKGSKINLGKRQFGKLQEVSDLKGCCPLCPPGQVRWMNYPSSDKGVAIVVE